MNNPPRTKREVAAGPLARRTIIVCSEEATGFAGAAGWAVPPPGHSHDTAAPASPSRSMRRRNSILAELFTSSAICLHTRGKQQCTATHRRLYSIEHTFSVWVRRSSKHAPPLLALPLVPAVTHGGSGARAGPLHILGGVCVGT